MSSPTEGQPPELLILLPIYRMYIIAKLYIYHKRAWLYWFCFSRSRCECKVMAINIESELLWVQY